jgi:hypothetical protein
MSQSCKTAPPRNSRLIAAGVAAFAALTLLACSSNPSIGDAKREHLFPAICEKQQQCLSSDFAAEYPGGLEDCKTRLNEGVPTTQNDQQSACSDDDWKSCVRDLGAATCPTDPAEGGLPPLPASCDKC